MNVHQELKKISDTKWTVERKAHEKMPGLVSVCMPNYNKDKYLAEAIQSIANQSYLNIELIIVDDFSSDSSRSVIHEAVAKHRSRLKFRVMNLPLRKGTAWAQNIAYYLSSGEFIVNMDSDDCCHPDRITRQVEALRGLEWDVCGTNFQIFDKDPLKPVLADGGYWLKYNTDEIQDSYLFKKVHCVCFGSLMFKANVIDVIGGMNKEFIGTEDYEIVHRIAVKGYTIGNLKEPLYYYRSSDNQRSSLFHKN